MQNQKSEKAIYSYNHDISFEKQKKKTPFYA